MSSLWAVSSDLYWVKVEVFVLSKQTVWFQKFWIAAKNYPMKKVSRIISSLREMDLKGKGVGGYGISQSDLLKELLIKIVWAFLSMLFFKATIAMALKKIGKGTSFCCFLYQPGNNLFVQVALPIFTHRLSFSLGELVISKYAKSIK